MNWWEMENFQRNRSLINCLSLYSSYLFFSSVILHKTFEHFAQMRERCFVVESLHSLVIMITRIALITLLLVST